MTILQMVTHCKPLSWSLFQLHMFEIKCGRKSLAFFKSLYAASSEEIPDNQYVTITECTDESSLNYLLHLGIIEHHPHNSRLVRMTCI